MKNHVKPPTPSTRGSGNQGLKDSREKDDKDGEKILSIGRSEDEKPGSGERHPPMEHDEDGIVTRGPTKK